MHCCRLIGLSLLLPLGLFAAKPNPIQQPERAVALQVAANRPNAVEQLIGLGNSLGLGQQAKSFLPADEAFQLSAGVRDDHTIVVNWVIADGYYLYKDKFKIDAGDAQGIRIRAVQLPAGEVQEDEFFWRMEIYHNAVEALAELERTDLQATEIILAVTYQGCAEAGICYPPINKSVPLMLAAANPLPAVTPAATPGT